MERFLCEKKSFSHSEERKSSRAAIQVRQVHRLYRNRVAQVSGSYASCKRLLRAWVQVCVRQPYAQDPSMIVRRQRIFHILNHVHWLSVVLNHNRPHLSARIDREGVPHGGRHRSRQLICKPCGGCGTKRGVVDCIGRNLIREFSVGNRLVRHRNNYKTTRSRRLLFVLTKTSLHFLWELYHQVIRCKNLRTLEGA